MDRCSVCRRIVWPWQRRIKDLIVKDEYKHIPKSDVKSYMISHVGGYDHLKCHPKLEKLIDKAKKEE